MRRTALRGISITAAACCAPAAETSPTEAAIVTVSGVAAS